MEEETGIEPTTPDTDGSVFVGAEDMGMSESFTPTGMVEELPPPEPISGCQCDQTEDGPMGAGLWFFGLIALLGFSRRRSH